MTESILICDKMLRDVLPYSDVLTVLRDSIRECSFGTSNSDIMSRLCGSLKGVCTRDVILIYENVSIFCINDLNYFYCDFNLL